MGVPAPYDDRVHHPGPDDVVHEPSAADEQARVLEPLDRNADEFHSEWPDYTISAGRALMIGIEFTTFSLIGRCERTGMLGIAIATSEMAVGSRCIHVPSAAEWLAAQRRGDR